MGTASKNKVLFCLESLLISMFFSFLIYIQTSKYGIGLSPDSITYLKLANAISQEGFVFIINNPSATFPPFYPLLLSVVSVLFNIDILIIARWFNIVLVFLFSFLSLVLYRKLTKNLLILPALGLIVAFSKPTNLVFCYAWSESLFIFIILLITFSIETTTCKRSILCGLLTSLAILTRYAGVAIIPAVCLYIFIQKSEFAEKIKKCFCYATLPVLIYIVYIARNYCFTKTFMGERPASATGLISNCDRAISTVVFWWNNSYNFMFFSVFFVLGAFTWNYRKELTQYFFTSPNIVKFSACYFLIYFLFITLSSTVTAYDLIDDRLMSPIFLSTTILILYVITYIVSKKEIFSGTVLVVLVVCFALSFAKTTVKEIIMRMDEGAGQYASAFWQENELLNYLKKDKKIFLKNIYTNDIAPFFLIDRSLRPKMIPSKKNNNSAQFIGANLENLVIKYPDLKNSYLVYFNVDDRKDVFQLKELQAICEMDIIVETVSGTLFKLGECK